MTDLIEAEVLILGCGIAGATTALKLADQGIRVTVVTRAREPWESNTYYAQGGIIFRGRNDSSESLATDIIRGIPYGTHKVLAVPSGSPRRVAAVSAARRAS